jgi:3-deoxy-D-manno-octulosonate 8-phosphate phosphatase (KDO 8-P phosphatase)
LGQSHKIEAFEEALHAWQLSPEEVAYMGDDYPDLPVLAHVGLPCCPADACTEVKQISAYISQEKGGMGAARDLIERTMKIQGTWDREDSHHW